TRQAEGPAGLARGYYWGGGRMTNGAPAPIIAIQGLKKESPMKRTLIVAATTILGVGVWVLAQPAGDPLIEGYRNVEVASVSDAVEQLYGQQSFMSHEMRALTPVKFAGPAVTVLLKKEEHKEGAAASQ